VLRKATEATDGEILTATGRTTEGDPEGARTEVYGARRRFLLRCTRRSEEGDRDGLTDGDPDGKSPDGTTEGDPAWCSGTDGDGATEGDSDGDRDVKAGVATGDGLTDGDPDGNSDGTTGRRSPLVFPDGDADGARRRFRRRLVTVLRSTETG
jgi:hypothetical protein